MVGLSVHFYHDFPPSRVEVERAILSANSNSKLLLTSASPHSRVHVFSLVSLLSPEGLELCTCDPHEMGLIPIFGIGS